ncbi:hypothetical protein Aperf_G00000108972 [Anoplocephala perfoliata]
MTKEEIEQYVVLLREELERERAERNKMALERDKVTTFWETSKQQAEEARGLLRKKERELEDAEERHQMEMRVYRQKIKHLLFEQNARHVDSRQDTIVTLNARAEETRIEVRELLNENYRLKAQMRFRELESEDVVKNLTKQHETEMTALRQDFILQAEEMKQLADKKAVQLRDDLETQLASEIHATEERRNLHIKQLEMAHSKALNNMKSYYNDITLGNINVIKTLKESIEDLRSNLFRMHQDLETSKSEMSEYKKKLHESENQNRNLRKVAHLFDSEKFAHNVTRANLRAANKAKANYEMLYTIAQTRLEELESDMKRLTERMEIALLEIKKKSVLRSALLEKKLIRLVSTLEVKQAEVDALLMTGADPEAVNESRRNLEELMNRKNTAIKELQLEVARMAKAYTDLWNICEQKLGDEMSSYIKPIETAPTYKSPFTSAMAQAKSLLAISCASENADTLSEGKASQELAAFTSS